MTFMTHHHALLARLLMYQEFSPSLAFVCLVMGWGCTPDSKPLNYPTRSCPHYLSYNPN
jgi:hypothetical protein